MGQVRTFIAVELPDHLKRQVDKLVVSLKPLAGGVRWVKAANLHFTLRFLGNIESDSVPALAEQLRKNLENTKPFSICLSGLGCFPNMRRPRVIWLGTGGDEENFKTLANEVESACRRCGYDKADKTFSPHLTIGRIKFPKGLEVLTENLQKIQFKSDEFNINQVVIFKSDLSPRGPTYTPMAKVVLES